MRKLRFLMFCGFWVLACFDLWVGFVRLEFFVFGFGGLRGFYCFDYLFCCV